MMNSSEMNTTIPPGEGSHDHPKRLFREGGATQSDTHLDVVSLGGETYLMQSLTQGKLEKTGHSVDPLLLGQALSRMRLMGISVRAENLFGIPDKGGGFQAIVVLGASPK